MTKFIFDNKDRNERYIKMLGKFMYEHPEKFKLNRSDFRIDPNSLDTVDLSFSLYFYDFVDLSIALKESFER